MDPIAPIDRNEERSLFGLLAMQTDEALRHILRRLALTPHRTSLRNSVRNEMDLRYELRAADPETDEPRVSLRLRRVLDKAGIKTVDDLLSANEAALWDLPGFGAASAREIEHYRMRWAATHPRTGPPAEALTEEKLPERLAAYARAIASLVAEDAQKEIDNLRTRIEALELRAGPLKPPEQELP